MKKALVLLVMIVVGGGWTANKFLQRSNKSAEERQRFIERTGRYNYDAETFLTEKTKQHHDQAFAASYRMWKFSPISELDLSTQYDQQTYYRTLGKLIAEDAKNEGQADAYAALLDIGRFYGMPHDVKKPSLQTDLANQSPSAQPKTTKTEDSKGSPLKKSKLGEKRAIPSGRRHEDHR